MAEKYIYKELCKRLKDKIKYERDHNYFFLEDLAEMTGFNRNTISLIESTGNPTISQYFEICMAINLDPTEIFKHGLRKDTRFKLTPKRRDSAKITKRITELVNGTFFDVPKNTKDVVIELQHKFPELKKLETKNISVILRRLVTAKKLIVTSNVSRINHYKKR